MLIHSDCRLSEPSSDSRGLLISFAEKANKLALLDRFCVKTIEFCVVYFLEVDRKLLFRFITLVAVDDLANNFCLTNKYLQSNINILI